MSRNMLSRSSIVAALCVAVGLVGVGNAAHATDVKRYPARAELHTFQSLTLPDSAFLRGDATAGKPVTLAGELRVAQGSGKLPLVVLMHGSSGIGSNIDLWADQLNAMGVSTFALDSMTGRGLTAVGANQGALGRLNFVLDIFKALDVVAKHPRVDPARIALMGFSRGGQAVLYASLDRFHKSWNTSGVSFVAYVPFYPACVTRYRNDTEVQRVPIAIFHGEADDYNELAPCKAYAERLKAAGRDVVVHAYAGAPHGFDVPTLAGKKIQAKTSQTARRCSVSESEDGTLVNDETKVAFNYKDACVLLGPHVGGDAPATAAATKEVAAFMSRVLKLAN